MIVTCDGVKIQAFTLAPNSTEVAVSPLFFVFFIEFIAIFLVTISTIYFGFLMISIKVWHENLTAIFISFIAFVFLRNIGRVMVMLESLSLRHPSECNPALLVGSFVTIFANTLEVHTPIAIFIERSFAFYYLEDYESKRRRQIPIMIVGAMGLLSLGLGLCIYLVVVRYILALVYALLVAILIVPSFIYLWYLNQKSYNQHGSHAKIAIYNLSKRFQLAENLRLLRNMILSAVLVVSIMCVVRITLDYCLVEWVYIFVQSIFSLFPLFIIMTCILSCRRWRNHAMKKMNLDKWRKHLIRRRVHLGSEQDVYFYHLNQAWSYEHLFKKK